MLLPHDGRHVSLIEDGALARVTDQEIRRSRRGALDLVANSLHHRRDALRRVNAGGDDVAFTHAETPRRVNRVK